MESSEPIVISSDDSDVMIVEEYEPDQTYANVNEFTEQNVSETPQRADSDDDQVFLNLQGSGIDQFMPECDPPEKSKKRSSISSENISPTKQLKIGDANVSHKCKHCLICYKTHDELIYHLRTHKEEKLFRCKDCDKVFLQKCHLNKHMRIHKIHKCSKCAQEFTEIGNLIRHIKEIHPKTNKYKCRHCDISFTRRETLEGHERMHTGNSVYQCETCDKVCNNLDNLNAHMNIHKGEKPYKCKLCDSSFSARSCLTRHENIHTGQTADQYRCELCDRRFRRKDSFDRHTKSSNHALRVLRR